MGEQENLEEKNDVDANSEDVITIPKAAFEERLARAKRSQLRELGFSSPEELQGALEAAKQLQAEQEERRKAEMSELERLKEEAAQEVARRKALESQLAEERFNGQVAAACSKLGITNLDFASYQVSRAASKLGAGEELSIESYLAEQRDAQPAAFGIKVAQSAPVTTTATTEKPVSSTEQPQGKSPAEMSPEEFQRHLASLGLV